MGKRAGKKREKSLANKRTLDARPDTLDFRDRMYLPGLVEVPTEISLGRYRESRVPILDQGQEGACTGFGLATVANYLLRTRRIIADTEPVSARMLYAMARRYDEWAGEDYDGSSARGAMKGWHKHGVCSAEAWPYQVADSNSTLTPLRAEDARLRPLGAYFRVNHKDVVAMHSAIAEVGILYATGLVHSGWDALDSQGVIPFDGGQTIQGGHAFAIVGYDHRGFWIQNSWGHDWGHEGFALVTYDDWLENGTDVWVARLGAPIRIRTQAGTASLNADMGAGIAGYTFHDLRPHIVSLGNDGRFRDTGTYGTSREEAQAIFEEDFPRITQHWKRKRLLIYTHGGLTSVEAAAQRVADYRSELLRNEVYPVAFVWQTDFWSTLKNILRDALIRRQAEGMFDAAKDFMLDRLDDALEPLARQLTGYAQWQEMKENALLATTSSQGGGRQVCDMISKLAKQTDNFELHVVGFSAGAVLSAPLVQYLSGQGKPTQGPMKGRVSKGLGLPISTCTLWAPACTVELFKETYLLALQKQRIGRLSLFTLTDRAEQNDDCQDIYHKSLLYLVSNAFEDPQRIPLFRPDGVPILGMEKFIIKDEVLTKLFDSKSADWIRAPNSAPIGSPDASTAISHGGFDDDRATVTATLARILGSAAAAEVTPTQFAAQQRNRMRDIAAAQHAMR